MEMVPESGLGGDDTGSERYVRKKEMFEDVNACPVCEGEERYFLLSRYALDVYRCPQCTLSYMHPRIRYDEIFKIYAHDKTAADIYSSEMQVTIDETKYDYGLRLVDCFSDLPKGRILDIGCGTGLFLKRAKRFGYEDCLGVDPNELYKGGYKNTEGITFHSSNLESLDISVLGKDFDCVSMWSTLEHIYYPYALFEGINTIIKPGGIFLFFLPNTNALDCGSLQQFNTIIQSTSPHF